MNFRGESAAATVSALTPSKAPPAPLAVAAATGSRGIKVTWQAYSGAGISFAVERFTSDGQWTTIATSLPVGTTSYADGGLQGGTPYSYRITASNSDGSNSTIVSAMTAPYPPVNGLPDALATLPKDGAIDASIYALQSYPFQASDQKDFWYYNLGTYLVQPSTMGFSDNSTQPGVAIFSTGGSALIPLIPSDATHNSALDTWFSSAEYGKKVVVSGNRIFVSAPAAIRDSSEPSPVRSGAVYVFEWNGTTFIQVKKIVALDVGGMSNGSAGDRFGDALAADGDRVIIGAPNAAVAIGGPTYTGAGRAYLFERNGSGAWVQNRSEFASVLESQLHFGASVAIRGRHFVVGAPNQSKIIWLWVQIYPGLFQYRPVVFNEVGSVYFGRWDLAGDGMVGYENPIASVLFQNGIVSSVNNYNLLGIRWSHFGASIALDSRLRLMVGASDNSWSPSDPPNAAVSGYWGGCMTELYWNGETGQAWSGNFQMFSNPQFNFRWGRAVKLDLLSQEFLITSNTSGTDSSPLASLYVGAFTGIQGSRMAELRGFDPDGDPVAYSVISGTVTPWNIYGTAGASILVAGASQFSVENTADGKSYLKTGSGLTPGATYRVGIRESDDRGGFRDFNLNVNIAGATGSISWAQWAASKGLDPNNPGISLSGDGLSAYNKYLRSIAGYQYGIDPYQWDLEVGVDYDGDGVNNEEDIEPFNPVIGRLKIDVTQPANNASL